VQDHQPQVAVGEEAAEPGAAAAAAAAAAVAMAVPPVAEGVGVQAVPAAGEASVMAAMGMASVEVLVAHDASWGVPCDAY
jgi:hypothetical protein